MLEAYKYALHADLHALLHITET